MDKHSPAQRSFNMSRVKSKNTKPEMYVFGILDKLGINYLRHYQTYGKPDIAFPENKIAIFINGEFWHGRKFGKEKHAYQDSWVKKIYGNMLRDKKNYNLLRKEGWQIVKIWDSDLKKHPKRELNKIMEAIRKPLISKSDL